MITLHALLTKHYNSYVKWEGRKSLVEGNWRRLPIRLSLKFEDELNSSDAKDLLSSIQASLARLKLSQYAIYNWSILPDNSLALNLTELRKELTC